MLRPLLRSSLFGAAAVAAFALPSTASAQSFFFTSCVTPGVCGMVETFFTASLLTVRIANLDASFGSALSSAQLFFASALNPATPSVAFNLSTTASPSLSTVSLGTTPANAWTFNGLGGSNELDLSGFINVFIEGAAPTLNRSLPGDPDTGTWVTTNGFVDFTADLSGVTGASGAQLTGIGFCTDQDCASGDPLIATPEPATLTLFATGLIGVVAIRRRRKNV